MDLDTDRIRAIIAAPHAYYGDAGAIERDYRWYPNTTDLIAAQLTPGARVLDVGCGDGDTLLTLSGRLAYGLGVDSDPEHLALAEAARAERGADNIELALLDYPREAARLPDASFDLVVSQRGPLPDSPEGIATALRLLRPEGLLLCEEIAEQHQREVRAIFDDQPPGPPRAADLRDTLAAHGLEVRLVEDIITKWRFADVYVWLTYQCNVWSWLGRQLPEPGDPRIAAFARRYAEPGGAIEVTFHVARVAGVWRGSA